jgi:hypothetical protein
VVSTTGAEVAQQTCGLVQVGHLLAVAGMPVITPSPVQLIYGN